MEGAMTAYNVVRFKVKADHEQAFVDFHKQKRELNGMLDGALVKTGDRAYCLVAKWKDFDAIVAARSTMIGMLDQLRPMLEDLGGGLGQTDPVSGSTVAELTGK
jgi:hypothetical protein